LAVVLYSYMQQLNEIVQIVTATLLGLVCIFLARHSKRGLHTWTGIGFALCILCYVVIESEAVQSLPALHLVAMIGAICIPLLFWLLARAIFDDHFRVTPMILVWLVIQVVPHFNFFLVVKSIRLPCGCWIRIHLNYAVM
jgi:hypothetical protein